MFPRAPVFQNRPKADKGERVHARIRQGAIVLAALVVLTGCGGDDDVPATADQVAAGGEQPTAAPTASATPTPSADPSDTPVPDAVPTATRPAEAPEPDPATPAVGEWPGARLVELTKGFDYDIGGPTVPRLSADGSHVGWVALNDYGEGDPNQVIVRSVGGGPFQIASSAKDGTPGDRGGDEFSLSANGRVVAFSSASTNLVPGDTGGQRHIYVKNLDSGKIERVSTDDTGEPADGDSSKPSLSADGRTVVFTSAADDLGDGSNAKGKADVFVKDLDAGDIRLVSADASGKPLAAGGTDGVISGDGGTVVFTHGDNKSLQVRRLSGGAVTAVDSPVDGTTPLFAKNLTVSHNGKVFAFVSGLALRGDTNDSPDLLVADLSSGKLTRASLAPDGTQFTSGSDSGSISPDGTRVVYTPRYAHNEDEKLTGMLVRTLSDGTTIRVADKVGDDPTIATKNDRVAFDQGGKIYVVSR